MQCIISPNMKQPSRSFHKFYIFPSPSSFRHSLSRFYILLTTPPLTLLYFAVFSSLSLVDAAIHHASTSETEREGLGRLRIEEDRQILYITRVVKREMRDWMTPAASPPTASLQLGDGSHLISTAVEPKCSIRQTLGQRVTLL